MKTKIIVGLLVLFVASLTGCPTQSTQQNGNFDEELRALQLEYHNLDQSFAARPSHPLTAEGAAETVRELDKELVGYQNIYNREHAIFAKYHKELASENIAYEAAKLRYVQAIREFYSYLAETDFNHGSNANPAEYRRIEKAQHEAFVEEQQAADALHRAKGGK